MSKFISTKTDDLEKRVGADGISSLKHSLEDKRRNTMASPAVIRDAEESTNAAYLEVKLG